VVTGTVTELWRYPVKSMLGEQLETATIGEHGVTGDRSFALIDTETGKVCSAKRHDLYGRLFEFRAQLLTDDPLTARIEFPDGSEGTTADADISERISAVLNRSVTLSATAPENATIEEIWPEVKGQRKYGPTVDEHDGESVIEIGASFALPGDFFDFSAIHLLTTNTLEELRRLEPATVFDVRRFRPNIVVEVPEEAGFVENDWSSIRVGKLELNVLMPVPRCVMTTLAQDELAKDSGVLRATARHNMIEAGPLGPLPCAGVYAAVESGATISVGETVSA
jgi:hypothetical protein